MSALQDNKTFLSGVLSGKILNFDADVFGLWVSVFENVNLTSNGYSYPQPLVQDITTINYALTGKKFSILNFDGKYADVRFLITSGKKGLDIYENTEILADISNSFVSGYSPLIIMPDMDFSGKVYRKQNFTGEVKSLFGNYNVLTVSGEDWLPTNINVIAQNSDIEYAYYDSGYSGYSNEVNTQYKFLYDDKNNSVQQNFSLFDLPTQVEFGSDLRYRISRKSDPLGSFYTPNITSDGKVFLDYSNFKDEVSGSAFSKGNYSFEPVTKLIFPKQVFNNLRKQDDGDFITRKIQDSNITGLKISNAQEEGYDVFKFELLSTGNYSDVYKVSFNFNRFNVSEKTDVTGYVLTGINTGNGSPSLIIDVGINSGVYPRVIQSNRYDSDNLLQLANTDELIFNEEVAQEFGANIDYGDEKNLANNLKQDINNRVSLLNELLMDEPAPAGGEISNVDINRRTIDDIEIQNLNNDNQNYIVQKFTLPTFPLPKQIVNQDYYSNYLNSGEKYVATPLVAYNNNLSFIYYGDEYGQLGYYVDLVNDKPIRTVLNSTCEGVYINKTSVCKGDTAIYANMPYQEGIYIANGLETQIPSNGIISKTNFGSLDSWESAINYYYNKNILTSCNTYPTDSNEGFIKALNNAYSEALSVAGKGSGSFSSEGSVGEKNPRIFVEREIYVQPYNSNQIALLNNTFNSGFYQADVELVDSAQEKLYAIQSFDTDFCKNLNRYFYSSCNFKELLNFTSLITHRDPNDTSKIIINYSTGESFGTVLSSKVELNSNELYRPEYVTGSAFSYAGLSNFIAWNGLANGTISISNQDELYYSYHLYDYDNNNDILSFRKSDVKNGETASVSKSKAAVLKFNKKSFTDNSYILNIDTSSFRCIDTVVLNSSNNLVDSSKVFFNLKKYTYSPILQNDTNQWFTNKQNPINDDNYGADNTFGLTIPRFFQDSSEDSQSIGLELLNPPNGPSSSKNYEGKIVDRSNFNSFSDGILENTLEIKEKNQSFSFENDFVLDFNNSDGKLIKFKEYAQTDLKNISFSRSKRLKISRVKYNFFVKDLVLIGDAGFPYSIQLNTAWEYKLQYKKSTSSTWLEMDNISSLSNNNIAAVFNYINPFFYKSKDLETPNYLSMVSFSNNLPWFLDDSEYQFRIFKYQKLQSPSSSVDIIRKVNFLPVEVNWNVDSRCNYFNVFQVDSGNNYKLINTETVNTNKSYVVPSIKQQYFDLGLASYPINGSGYYNIVVSGSLPSIKDLSIDVSGLFNNIKIGNDDSNGQQSKISIVDNTNNSSGFVGLQNVTYSPLIDFNNPESKQESFTISNNYSGYYFITNGKDVNLSSVFQDFECYVANTGSSCTFYGSSNISMPTNRIVNVAKYPTITTSTLSSLSEGATILQNSEFLYIKENVTIDNSSSFQATVINDSSSANTITYGAGSVSIPANTTSYINFTNPNTISISKNYENIEYSSSTAKSNKEFINFDRKEILLNNQDYSSLGIFNFSKESLSINNNATLDADSFYLVDWNGKSSPSSTPTLTKKDYSDSIKVFLDGTENSDDSTILLTDDTDIYISNFSSDQTVSKTYFFLKNEIVSRALNIKIINGSEEFVLPRGAQDFQLILSKGKSEVTYKILYPSSDFATVIGDAPEQLLLVKNNGTVIDVGYVEASLKSNSFVYILNKSSTDVLFKRNFVENIFSLGPNKIARVILQKGSNKAFITEAFGAYDHLNFKIDPAIHLTGVSGVNLLNLRFCDTKISLPQVSSFAGEDAFLLFKNKFLPNKIDEISVKQKDPLLEDGKLVNNSKIIKLYRDSISDTNPTIQRLEVDSLNIHDVFGEKLSSDDPYSDSDFDYDFDLFYIKDTGLANITVEDFYNRKKLYQGKIISSTNRFLNINSFDEISKNRSKGSFFDFKFDVGTCPDGSFYSKTTTDDVILFNQQNQEVAAKSIDQIKTNHLCVNFSYSSIGLPSSKNLYKNRIVNNSSVFYPIYNEKEFFIASVKTETKTDYYSTSSYFYNFNFDSDIDAIVIAAPASVSTSHKYIFHNQSSRPIEIKRIDDNSVFITLNPNDKKTISSNGSTWQSSNYNSSSDGILTNGQPLQIKFENQFYEIDKNHILKYVWREANTSQGLLDLIEQAFIPNSVQEDRVDVLLEENNRYTINDITTNGVYTNSINASLLTIFCYGRYGGTKEFSDKEFYVLNDFYNYVVCDNQIIKRNYVLRKRVSYDNVLELSNFKFSTIERKHIDIGSFFIGRYGSVDINNLGTNFLIPFYKEAITFYLPNLDYIDVNGNSYGSILLNKKFIFINLAQVNQECPNNIYNYSNTALNTDLLDINTDSVAVFYVAFESGNYIWKKQTLDLPIIKNCFPEVSSLKGVDKFSTSNVTDGNEFLYLPNINTFSISIDSFTDGHFKNFYLYNSCGYPLSLIFNNSVRLLIYGTDFVKVEYDGISYSLVPKNAVFNTSFLESDLFQIRSGKVEDCLSKINEIYKNPPPGAFLKFNFYSDNENIKYFIFLSSEIGETGNFWKIIDLNKISFDGDWPGILDLSKSEQYLADFKLFIYGSFSRNETEYTFDKYTLYLKDFQKRSSSFFIFNNTISALTVLSTTGGRFQIPPFRLVKLYKLNGENRLTFCNSYQQSKFYISYSQDNINYIQRENIKILLDGIKDINLDNGIEIDFDQTNSLLTLTNQFSNQCVVESASSSNNSISYIDSLKVYSLSDLEDTFQYLKFSQSYFLLKPSYSISSAGHYLITNSNRTIDLTTSTSDTFLINNTSENILVTIGNASKILYRNTVLVINNTSSKYLKKAKNKDAFYSIFNPKTVVSTQRELGVTLGIDQFKQLLPVCNLNYAEQSSFVTLYSKTNEKKTIFLNFNDYYLGQDIPSNVAKNILAYEVGIGHETIYKFLFFDPSENYYTLPGIVSGIEYIVEIDEGFFYDLRLGENLNNVIENFESYRLGSVRYMGQIYRNGQTFIGKESSWYEVDFPNFVRVSKVVREFPNGFDSSYKPEQEIDLDSNNPDIPEDLDPLSTFKEEIYNSISSKLALKADKPATVCWIPENQNAFWLDSNFNKDIWTIVNVDSSSVVKITHTKDGDTKELSFVKCTFKKDRMKTPVFNYYYIFYSALQEKLEMSDTGDITIGFDYNLTPTQKGKLKNNIIGQYSQDDYIYSDKQFLLAVVRKEDLFQEIRLESDRASQLTDTNFEITITLEKLKNMPSITIEDFSLNPVIKLLNQE